MDRAEALASSAASTTRPGWRSLWGDALLIKRFLTQCSRTGSKATRDGYRCEIRRSCALA